MRTLARLAVLAFFATSVAAHADTLSTFNISGGSLFFGMGGDANTVSGTTTIDVTTGAVQSIAFTAGGVYESGVDAQYGNVIFVGSAGAKFTVSGVTLVNFTGDNLNLNGPNDLYVGQLSLADVGDAPDPTGPLTGVSVTPEPASLLLLSTGLMGVALMTRRRSA